MEKKFEEKKDFSEMKGGKRNKPYNKNRNSGKPSDGQRRNDPSFYLVTPAIRDSVANVPFNIFPGTRERQALALSGTTPTFTDASHLTTPGVMSLKWIPTYGSADLSDATALNTASKALYTYVRHQNSGHANYESADLMLYIITMDNIYVMYHDVKRMLEITKQYEIVNRNTPSVIAQALGFDLADAQANYAIYRGKLNLLAAKISAMAVPNVFNIFKRHTVLSSCILTDSDSRRSQFYVYTPNYVLTYNATKTTAGGGMDRTAWNASTTAATVATYLSTLESAINIVLADEDCNIMSGDILKAYGRESLYTLAELNEFETCPILYDVNMLQQIENTITLPISINSTTFGQIVQSDNFIAQNLDVSTSQWIVKLWVELLNKAAYFNSHKDEVTTDDVIEYTRNMLGVDYTPGSSTAYVVPGSEAITNIQIYTYNYQSGIASITNYYYRTLMDTTATVNPCQYWSLLSKFDWHPIIHPLWDTGTGSSQSVTYYGPAGDFKKYTILSNEQIQSFNEIAILGELGALVINEFNRRG